MIQVNKMSRDPKHTRLMRRLAFASIFLIGVTLIFFSAMKHIELVLISNIFKISSPQVTLLLSYPNSGTTYTISTVRNLTGKVTGTNYAKESNSKKLLYPSMNGPFVKKDSLDIPKKLLTKTHCHGYGSSNRIKDYIVNPQQFASRCRSVQKSGTKYSKYHEQVKAKTKSAVRLVRDPFDNIVSNYHHWLHNRMKKRDKIAKISSDVERFQAYCQRMDKQFEDSMKRRPVQMFQRVEVQDMIKKVPCHQLFFRYAQWHNNCNPLEDELDTLLIRYEDYENKFNQTITKLLDFLELDMVVKEDEIPSFQTGKTYRHYYSDEQKKVISKWLRHLAEPRTLKLISSYLVD